MCSQVLVDLKQGWPLEPLVASQHMLLCTDLFVTENDTSITNLKCICNLIGCYQNDVICCITSQLIDKLLKLSCEDKFSKITPDEQCFILKILGNLVSCELLIDEHCRKIWKAFCGSLFNQSFKNISLSLSTNTLDVLFMIVNATLRHRLAEEFLNDDSSFLNPVLNVCFFSDKVEGSNFDTVLVHTVIDVIHNYPSVFRQLNASVQLALTDYILEEASDQQIKEELALFLFSEVFEPNFAKLASEHVSYNWSQAAIFHNTIKIFCEWSTKDYKSINETLPTLNSRILRLVEACRRWDFQNLDTDSTNDNEQPVFQGFLSDLMRLLANLVYQNKDKQDECHSYLPILLGNFKVENRNPFLREWNVLFLRNVLENNTRNQKFVHNLKPEEILPNSVLEKLSPTVDLRSRIFKE